MWGRRPGASENAPPPNARWVDLRTGGLALRRRGVHQRPLVHWRRLSRLSCCTVLGKTCRTCAGQRAHGLVDVFLHPRADDAQVAPASASVQSAPYIDGDDITRRYIRVKPSKRMRLDLVRKTARKPAPGGPIVAHSGTRTRPLEPDPRRGGPRRVGPRERRQGRRHLSRRRRPLHGPCRERARSKRSGRTLKLELIGR